MPRHLRYWVGLDAGHLETAVCLVDAEGNVFFEAMTETRAAPIRDILRRSALSLSSLLRSRPVSALRWFGISVRSVFPFKSPTFANQANSWRSDVKRQMRMMPKVSLSLADWRSPSVPMFSSNRWSTRTSG